MLLTTKLWAPLFSSFLFFHHPSPANNVNSILSLWVYMYKYDYQGVLLLACYYTTPWPGDEFHCSRTEIQCRFTCTWHVYRARDTDRFGIDYKYNGCSLVVVYRNTIRGRENEKTLGVVHSRLPNMNWGVWRPFSVLQCHVTPCTCDMPSARREVQSTIMHNIMRGQSCPCPMYMYNLHWTKTII